MNLWRYSQNIHQVSATSTFTVAIVRKHLNFQAWRGSKSYGSEIVLSTFLSNRKMKGSLWMACMKIKPYRLQEHFIDDTQNRAALSSSSLSADSEHKPQRGHNCTWPLVSDKCYLHKTSICVSFQQTPTCLFFSGFWFYTTHESSCNAQKDKSNGHEVYSDLSNILVLHNCWASLSSPIKLPQNNYCKRIFFLFQTKEFFLKQLLCWQSKIIVLAPKMPIKN